MYNRFDMKRFYSAVNVNMDESLQPPPLKESTGFIRQIFL